VKRNDQTTNAKGRNKNKFKRLHKDRNVCRVSILDDMPEDFQVDGDGKENLNERPSDMDSEQSGGYNR
jgi:hypothetical protein